MDKHHKQIEIIKQKVAQITTLLREQASTFVVSDNQLTYDIPNNTNTNIWFGNNKPPEMISDTRTITLEPIYIRYRISRETFESHHSTAHDAVFAQQIQTLLQQYANKEQTLMLYDTTLKHIENICNNDKIQRISATSLNTNDILIAMEQMKAQISNTNTLNGACWIVSPAFYQIINSVNANTIFNQEWKQYLSGLPVYICHNLKNPQYAILANMPEAYCIVTNPSHTAIFIDENTAENVDCYSINITIYVGSAILNPNAIFILEYTPAGLLVEHTKED